MGSVHEDSPERAKQEQLTALQYINDQIEQVGIINATGHVTYPAGSLDTLKTMKQELRALLNITN